MTESATWPGGMKKLILPQSRKRASVDFCSPIVVEYQRNSQHLESLKELVTEKPTELR